MPDASTDQNGAMQSVPATISRPATVPLLVEILVVIALAVLPNLCAAFASYEEPIQPSFFYTHLSLICQSLQIAAPLLLIIHLTGGRWSQHGLGNWPTLTDLALAPMIAVIAWLAADCLYQFVLHLGGELHRDFIDPIAHESFPASRELTFLVICLSAMANGWCEELAMRAWLIPKLESLTESRWAALLISTWLFAGYHLYQGMIAVIMVFGIGLILGGAFLWLRRFWPIALAHMILDIVPYYWPST